MNYWKDARRGFWVFRRRIRAVRGRLLLGPPLSYQVGGDREEHDVEESSPSSSSA